MAAAGRIGGQGLLNALGQGVVPGEWLHSNAVISKKIKGLPMGYCGKAYMRSIFPLEDQVTAYLFCLAVAPLPAMFLKIRHK